MTILTERLFTWWKTFTLSASPLKIIFVCQNWLFPLGKILMKLKYLWQNIACPWTLRVPRWYWMLTSGSQSLLCSLLGANVYFLSVISSVLIHLTSNRMLTPASGVENRYKGGTNLGRESDQGTGLCWQLSARHRQNLTPKRRHLIPLMLSGTDSTEQLQANFTFFNPVFLLNIPFKRRMGWGSCLWSVWRDDRQEEASGACWRTHTVGRETQVPAHSPVVLSITAQASKNHHRDLVPTVLACPPKYQCWENKAFKWDHPVMLKCCKNPILWVLHFLIEG